MEVLCGAPPVLAAVQGEALGAMYAIVEESKTKSFLGPTEFRHLLALFLGIKVDGALTREALLKMLLLRRTRRWSRRGGDA